MGGIKTFTHTDKPTDIIAKGEGGFWKHLTYQEVLSSKMIDYLVAQLLDKYSKHIAVIEVRQNGKLVDLYKAII